jgi:hypothetical protein
LKLVKELVKELAMELAMEPAMKLAMELVTRGAEKTAKQFENHKRIRHPRTLIELI